MANTPFMMPVFGPPQMVEGAQVDIAGDTEVIGVVLPEGARAYVVDGMCAMSSHVVNDLVGESPLSVTYCDETDYARVFTKSDTNWPLGLAVGGRRDGKLLMRLNGQFYVQDASDIPLEDVDFVRTDWQSWFDRYPQTLVYLGM
jgi:hypothetical protein